MGIFPDKGASMPKALRVTFFTPYTGSSAGSLCHAVTYDAIRNIDGLITKAYKAMMAKNEIDAATLQLFVGPEWAFQKTSSKTKLTIIPIFNFRKF